LKSFLNLGGNSSSFLSLGELEVSDPLLVLGVLLNENSLSFRDLLSNGGLLVNLDSLGSLSDLSMNFLVKSLKV
jgi:hypothetical protein